MTSLSAVRVSVLVLLILPHFAEAQNAEEIKSGGTFDVEVVRDITYYDGKDADTNKHKLDLYLPKWQTDFPVLFFVHGGAWTVGSRWEHGMAGRLFAKNGVGVVLISYRLSPQVQHPGHIQDVARAFAWTHKNIGKYGGRADEIFVSGQSAGGHLAALLATNEEYLKGEQLSLKDIKGVIPISGVYSFRPGELEWVIGKGKDAAESASPLKHVSGKEPPFLIIYAEKEFHRIDKMSKDLFAALQKENVQAECVEIKDRNHISLMFWLMLSEADPGTQVLLKFLSKHSSLKLTPRERGEQKDKRKSATSETMRADPKNAVDRVAVPCPHLPIPTQPTEPFSRCRRTWRREASEQESG